MLIEYAVEIDMCFTVDFKLYYFKFYTKMVHCIYTYVLIALAE